MFSLGLYLVNIKTFYSSILKGEILLLKLGEAHILTVL